MIAVASLGVAEQEDGKTRPLLRTTRVRLQAMEQPAIQPVNGASAVGAVNEAVIEVDADER